MESDFALSVSDGTSGLDLDSLKTARERAWGRQEAFADQLAIALGEEEAMRFLDALKHPDEGTVARLEELRRRA